MNFDQWIDAITIIFGAGGIASFILSIKRSKSQNTLDLSSAWEKFSAPLMHRLAELEIKVDDQELEIEDLRGYVRRLVKQLIDNGIEPIEFIRRKRQVKNE